MSIITLYHGSRDIVEHPYFGGGRPYNDYGLGFYCTQILDLAREWSCTEGREGFANQYALDPSGLKILSLNSETYHILNWLAILLKNRTFDITGGLQEEAKTYLLDTFLPQYEDSDIIVGYRADDSYFAFAKAFLSGSLSLTQLKKAMALGKLGEQTVIRSKKAFEQLTFEGAEKVDYNIYFARRKARDLAARQDYLALTASTRASDEIYVLDILRQQWRNDDARLR